MSEFGVDSVEDLEWPAQRPDLNLIEHLLEEEWSKTPINTLNTR